MLLDEGRALEAIEVMLRLLGEFERLGDAQYHAMALGSMSWSAFKSEMASTGTPPYPDGFRSAEPSAPTLSTCISC